MLLSSTDIYLQNPFALNAPPERFSALSVCLCVYGEIVALFDLVKTLICSFPVLQKGSLPNSYSYCVALQFLAISEVCLVQLAFPL